MHLEPDLVEATWQYYLPILVPFYMAIESDVPVPDIPESDLYILASTDDSRILEHLAILPNLPSDLLEEIFQYFIDNREGLLDFGNVFDIERGLARNTSLPFHYFFQFDVTDSTIQRILEENDSTPPEVIHKIYEYQEYEAQFNEDVSSIYAWNSSSRYVNSADQMLTRYLSSGSRIQQAIKSEEDAKRFASYLENLAK